MTIGAATTAFYAYTMRQVRDTEGGILSGFFSAFRQHFKKATLLWLLEAAGIEFFLQQVAKFLCYAFRLE